jgi:drug/metabolite transporter (DMT)-like permease
MSLKYIAFSLLSVAIWGGNTTVNKLAAGALPPGVIAFERWLLAFVVLTPFVALDVWRNLKEILSNLPKLAVLGLLGMTICQGVGYYAARFTSATNMGLLLSLVPLSTLILGTIVRRRMPPGSVMFGGLLSFIGVSVILGQGDLSLFLSHGVGRGDVLMLLVVLALAGYNILLKSWSMPLHVLTSIYAQIGCAVVFLIPTYLWSEAPSYSWSNVTMILYAAIPGSIIAPVVWMSAVKHLGTERTSIFMNLIPIITAIIAATFLREKLYAYHLIGGGMTIAGVALSQRMPVKSLRRSNVVPAE